MYVESSWPNYPRVGPFALTSPSFEAAGGGAVAVRFWYHMNALLDGQPLGRGVRRTPRGARRRTKAGDQGDSWQFAEVVPAASAVGRVRFVGTTGTLYSSDMAIDDVDDLDRADARAACVGRADAEQGAGAAAPTAALYYSAVRRARAWSVGGNANCVGTIALNQTVRGSTVGAGSVYGNAAGDHFWVFA